MSGFIKYFRSDEAEFLLSYPAANHLLQVMAFRARRTDHPMNGLKAGQCLLGDHEAIGLTRQQYRSAMKRLEKLKLATFEGTNKGTIGMLINSNIYDINQDEPNQQGNHQATIEGTTQGTTQGTIEGTNEGTSRESVEKSLNTCSYVDSQNKRNQQGNHQATTEGTIEATNEGTTNKEVRSKNKEIRSKDLKENSKESENPVSKQKTKSSNTLDFSVLRFNQEEIQEFKHLRKLTKAPVTQRVINLHARQFELSRQAGFSNDDILNIWSDRGWRAFKHAWLLNYIRGQGDSAPEHDKPAGEPTQANHHPFDGAAFRDVSEKPDHDDWEPPKHSPLLSNPENPEGLIGEDKKREVEQVLKKRCDALGIDWEPPKRSPQIRSDE